MNKQQELFVKKITENSLMQSVFNYKMRIVVAAQFALESNWGKSKIATENSNLCGMKMPKTRPTTAKAERNGYAAYLNEYDCIVDYVIWIMWGRPYFKKLWHLDNYMQYLKEKNYSEDENYDAKVEAIYNEIYEHLKQKNND